MKKVFIVPAALLLLSAMLFFNSCQKQKDSLAIPLKEDESITSKIDAWLIKQKIGKTETGVKKIQSLINAAKVSQVRAEKLSDKERIFIVPLDKSFATKFDTNKDHASVLLLIENERGEIRKGNIVQYVPAAGLSAKEIPANTFHNYYNTMKINDGGYTFLSILGNFEYETNYTNGQMSSFKIKEKGKKDTNPGMQTSNQQCIDWYYVVRYFYIDGTTETTREYLYTTCTECDPTQDCADSGGGGGEGNPNEEEIEIVSAQKDWTVAVPVSGSWMVWSTESFTGVKTNNEAPMGGHFTGMTHSNDQIANFHPLDNIYTWHRSGVNVSSTTYTATASISGQVVDQNGITTVIPTKYQSWTFATVF